MVTLWSRSNVRHLYAGLLFTFHQTLLLRPPAGSPVVVPAQAGPRGIAHVVCGQWAAVPAVYINIRSRQRAFEHDRDRGAAGGRWTDSHRGSYSSIRLVPLHMDLKYDTYARSTCSACKDSTIGSTDLELHDLCECARDGHTVRGGMMRYGRVVGCRGCVRCLWYWCVWLSIDWASVRCVEVCGATCR